MSEAETVATRAKTVKAAEQKTEAAKKAAPKPKVAVANASKTRLGEIPLGSKPLPDSGKPSRLANRKTLAINTTPDTTKGFQTFPKGGEELTGDYVEGCPSYTKPMKVDLRMEPQILEHL